MTERRGAMLEAVAVLVALVVGIQIGRRIERRRMRWPVRHITLLVVLLLVAGCGGSLETVRSHVQSATQAYQHARATVADAMVLAARTAREAMDLELRLAGCATGSTSQPATEPAVCERIRWEHRDRLQARIDAIAECARAADAAVRGALDAMLAVMGEQGPEWAKVVTLATQVITRSRTLAECGSAGR
jgi:hypothetical protein